MPKQSNYTLPKKCFFPACFGTLYAGNPSWDDYCSRVCVVCSALPPDDRCDCTIYINGLDPKCIHP